MRSRSHFTGVWLNDAEYRQLMQLCQSSGLSASAMIRKCILELLRVLSGIGTNINQLAHWANGKGYVTQAQIHDAARFAREAWELVRESI